MSETATGLPPRPEPMVLGPMTRTDFVRYQGASGDMNPIHHDEPFATASGYPAPLAVGMFAAGAMASWGTSWLGPENARGARIRWKKPAFPGTVLTISGEVSRDWTEGDERRVELAISAIDQEDALSLQVWMTFVVPPAGE